VKKLVIAIVLVAVVVGGTFGGLAAANGGPTLKAIGFSSPGDITVVGTAWVPGLPVDLFMDVPDVNHHVGVATPDAKGGFTLKFGLLGTVIGNHVVIGVQGFGPPVNAPFTLKGSSPVDDRTYQEVANIEAKLDDPATGLAEIKAEVANIEDNVTSSDYGLQEIRDKIGKIINNDDWGLKEVKNEVANIEDLASEMVAVAGNTVQISTAGDCSTLTGSWQILHEDSQTNVKHVHLTVARQTNNFDLQLRIRVGRGGDYHGFYLVDATNVAPGVYTYEFDCVGFRLRAKSSSGGDVCYTLTKNYRPAIDAAEEPWPEE